MATASNTPAIDVKTAVRVATNYFDQIIQRNYDELGIEEVEKTDDDRFWLITVGYNVTPTGRGAIAVLGGPTVREYKIIKVDAQSGEPISMKVRKSF